MHAIDTTIITGRHYVSQVAKKDRAFVVINTCKAHEAALLQTLKSFLSKADTIQVQCGSQKFGTMGSDSTEVRSLGCIVWLL